MSAITRGIGSYFSVSVALAAFVISLTVLFTGGVFNNNNDNNAPGVTGSYAYISLYSSEAQIQQQSGWTNTVFNNQIIETTAWYRGEDNASVICNATGQYLVYFAIQAQVTPTTTTTASDISSRENVLPPCKICNLRYSIRATRNVLLLNETTGDSTEFTLEVEGSQTYSSGYAFHLSKQFFIFGNVGDVFQFQFISSCPKLSLYPSEYVVNGEVPTVSSETYPASANLIIM